MKQPSSKVFLKIGKKAVDIDPKNKVALIRRGNECYNKGEYDIAKRIYLTTNYSDGLIRMGQYYESKKEMLEALRMYWLAGDSSNKERMVQILASSIRELLRRDQQAGKRTGHDSITPKGQLPSRQLPKGQLF